MKKMRQNAKDQMKSHNQKLMIAFRAFLIKKNPVQKLREKAQE